MKTLINILFISMIAYATTYAQQANWDFDKSHSKIQFDVAHMVISEVTGQFHDYEGKIEIDKNDFTKSNISITIDAKSIDTDHEKRDGHLRAPDFFDVEKYPNITFISKSIEKIEKNIYKLSGDFTMHGITKAIDLNVKHIGTIKDPYGNTRAGFKVEGSINRTDYGMKYNSIMEAGGLLIGEDVSILCNFEIIQKDNLVKN